jgi:O-methyltransferase
VRQEYTAFARSERKRIMMSIARFAHINRPIEGYYFEFGCHEANTMRLAWDCFQHLFDWDYVAFDSFEGLPVVSEEDKSTIFYGGNLATNETEFISRVTAGGMPREKLTTVKGFYDTSLTQDLRDRLLPQRATVIYIDCDLYASTIPILDFIPPFLQKGTIIVFDDWNCYHGSPAHGERRAWKEFILANPAFSFEAFVSTGEAQSFICVSADGR